MAELKVATEVAQQDFDRMCVARRVDLDESQWDEDDKKTFAKLKAEIVKAISTGALTVDADGAPTLLAPSGESFKFRKPNGATLINMDGKTGTARVFAALADMSGRNTGEFSKLEMPELNLCARLYALFIQR